tara:strand:+ start:1634 stop:2131 length:498 start_codon:yes stop_codon:yes gene_type:complete
MNIKDAAKLLSLTGSVTQQDIKKAYRTAAHKYHPDRNPAGAEMMKLINAAFEVLKDFTGDIPESDAQQADYPEALNIALNAIHALTGLHIEICGAWVWVSGDTRTHKETLKAAGFKYASKKKCWYFRPEDWRSKSRGSLSMDEIRGKYGSTNPHAAERRALSAAK